MVSVHVIEMSNGTHWPTAGLFYGSLVNGYLVLVWLLVGSGCVTYGLVYT